MGTGQVNKEAYQQMIKEDLEWLKSANGGNVSGLYYGHIKQIVEQSVNYYYPESKAENLPISNVSNSVCPLCDGKGRRVFPNCTPPIDEICPACNGKGK